MQLEDLPLPVLFDEFVVIFACNPERCVLLCLGFRVKYPVGMGAENMPLPPGMGSILADLDHRRRDGQHQQQGRPVCVGVGQQSSLALDRVPVGIHPSAHGVPHALHMLLAQIRPGVHDLHPNIRVGVSPQVVPHLRNPAVLHVEYIPAHQVLDVHRVSGIAQSLDLLLQGRNGLQQFFFIHRTVPPSGWTIRFAPYCRCFTS